jgi:hypothetical protein
MNTKQRIKNKNYQFDILTQAKERADAFEFIQSTVKESRTVVRGIFETKRANSQPETFPRLHRDVYGF